TFYYEVLFKIRGTGFSYLLFLSLFLSIPLTYKVSALISAFREIHLSSVVAQIPPSYLDMSSRLVAEDNNDTYKELVNSDGILVAVFNIDDIPLEPSKQPLFELNSRTLTVNTSGSRAVVRYGDIFEPGSTFSPVTASEICEAFLSVGISAVFIFIAIWFFFVLAFNSVVTAVLSKIMFIVTGRMKTSFINMLRLSSFANTVVGLALILESILNIHVPFSIVMVIPLVYMFVFIRSFSSELKNEGVDGFIRKYAPKGTTVRTMPHSQNKDSNENVYSNSETPNKDSADENKDNNNSDNKGNGGGSGCFIP
ncbi:MAG: hypothetical protein ACI4M9_09235, partial [Succinivibrio sp.]